MPISFDESDDLSVIGDTALQDTVRLVHVEVRTPSEDGRGAEAVATRLTHLTATIEAAIRGTHQHRSPAEVLVAARAVDKAHRWVQEGGVDGDCASALRTRRDALMAIADAKFGA